MPYLAAVLGALPNWTTAPGVVITAGSTAAGTDPANLADANDLGALWRSTGLSPVTETWLQVDLDQPRPVSSVYLVRHAGRPGDTWRVRGGETTIATPPRLGPAAVATVAGTVTGTAADIDDPVDNATADALTLTGAATARVTLAAVGDPLGGGDASQLLRLRVKAADASPLAPKGWAVLVGAVEVAVGDLEDTGETTLEVPFSSALDPGGALVVDLVATGPGGLDVLAIEWRPETTGDATPTDTGWCPMVLAPELGLRHLEVGATPEELLRLTAAEHFVAGGAVEERTHRHWRIDLRAPGHPRGYVRAGLLALGPAYRLGLFDSFTGPRTRDLSTTLRTADGTAHTRQGPTLAEATLPVDATSLEGPRDLLALRRFVGRAGRFGVSLLPEEAAAPALSFWGHLATDGGLDHEPGQMHDDIHQRGFHWLETLEVHEV